MGQRCGKRERKNIAKETNRLSLSSVASLRRILFQNLKELAVK